MTLQQLYDKALQLFYDGEYMRSLSVANRLYGKAEMQGERVLIVKSLSLISLDLYVLQDYEYSLSEYLALIQILDQNKPEGIGPEAINNARYGAALCYQHLGELDLCFLNLKQVVELTESDEIKVKAYILLGETLRHSYELNNDESYLAKMYDYIETAFKSVQDPSLVPLLYNIKARALQSEGKLAEALESFMESDHLLTNEVFRATNYTEIAYCHLFLDQDELAFKYLQKAETALSKLSFSDDGEKARAYYIYGLYYKKKNNLEKAIEYFLKSEELYNGHQVCIELAKIYYELGRIYEKMNQPKKAGEKYCMYELYKDKVKKLGGEM